MAFLRDWTWVPCASCPTFPMPQGRLFGTPPPRSQPGLPPPPTLTTNGRSLSCSGERNNPARDHTARSQPGAKPPESRCSCLKCTPPAPTSQAHFQCGTAPGTIWSNTLDQAGVVPETDLKGESQREQARYATDEEGKQRISSGRREPVKGQSRSTPPRRPAPHQVSNQLKGRPGGRRAGLGPVYSPGRQPGPWSPPRPGL